MTSNKKRKYEDEHRAFLPEWEEDFAFTEKNGKPLCLICNAAISHHKASNVRRHYETNHNAFSRDYPASSELRKVKLAQLKSRLQSQQSLMKTFSKESDVAAEASFAIAWNIARTKRAYSEGEFVKTNISDVLALLDPNNKNLQRLVNQVPVSRHSVERRISQLSADVVDKLQEGLKSCKAFSLALDESTDIQDKPQLAIFIRYVSSDESVREELLDMVALKETTRGVDIKNALLTTLERFDVPLQKLVAIATDGAPAMVGKNVGLVGLLRSDPSIPDFLPIHCIIHREHLVAKHFSYKDVISTVLRVVNYIRSNAKTHRQFRNFLEELELHEAPIDVSFFCAVRWLSMNNVLSRFVDLLKPIQAFLEAKEKPCPELHDAGWCVDLGYLTDVVQHLKTLNMSLQGKEKMVSEFAQSVFSFQNKLKLFQNDLKTKRLIHFPRLKSMLDAEPEFELTDAKLREYFVKLEELERDFHSRFKDMHQLKPCFALLMNPFMVDVLSVDCPTMKNLAGDVGAFELELLELQEDEGLKTFLQSQKIAVFWGQVPEARYPHVKLAGQKLLSIFGSTYCCEAVFSTMKAVKSKQRATLTDDHLTELLRSATTSFEPNFKRLVLRMGKPNTDTQ